MLLSIVVPIFNVQEYMRKCLDSIIACDSKCLEIILVVDLRSSDESKEIACDYASKDTRITVVYQKEGNLVDARLIGAENAIGDYIMPIDGDDYIEPSRIEKAIAAIQSIRDLDIIYFSSGYIKVYNNMNIQIDAPEYSGIIDGNVSIADFLAKNLLDEVFFTKNILFSQWSFVTHRDKYLESHRELIMTGEVAAEDLCAVIMSMMESKKLLCIPDNSYFYIQRPGSGVQSNHVLKTINKNFACVLDFLNKKEATKLFELLVKQLYFECIVMSGGYEWLQKYSKNQLFLYPQVKKNSRIIIFGMGNIGRKFLKMIEHNKDYTVLGYSDTRCVQAEYSNKTYISPVQLCNYEYDYIVITVINGTMAKHIKEELIKLGVDEQKIALMSSYNMTDTIMADLLSEVG